MPTTTRRRRAPSLTPSLTEGALHPPVSRSAEPQLEQKAAGTYQIPSALFEGIPEEHRGNLFILIVDGDCLEDRAIVAPGMPIRPGDFVVLWPKNKTHRPSVKRVVLAPPAGWATWRSDECVPALIVEQLNPPRRYGIDTDWLSAIHRVVTTFRPGDYERSAIKPRAMKRSRQTVGGAR